MDVNTIKQRLDNLQAKTAKKPKTELVDYTKTFWKPTVGKHEIRIVPSKFNKQDPFKEVQFHYGIGNKKVMLALTNFGEKDPIVEFISELKKSGDDDSWKLIKKISPKTRYFVPVVVRGEEEKGVRLWEFGVKMFRALGTLASDEEIGDYTSITNGRDIKVTTVDKATTGTDYNESTVQPKMKESKLSEDKEEVTKWLEEQPDVLAAYKHYTFDEMKTILKDWITNKKDDETPEAEAKPSKATKAPVPTTSVKAPTKKSKTDEFDEVFKEDNGTDDLPF